MNAPVNYSRRGGGMGRVEGGAELGCKSYNGGERFGSRMKYARVKKNMRAFEMLAMTAGGGVGWGGVGCGWGGWGAAVWCRWLLNWA